MAAFILPWENPSRHGREVRRSFVTDRLGLHSVVSHKDTDFIYEKNFSLHVDLTIY